MSKVFGATAILCALFAFPAASQETTEDIRRCSAITDSVKRLECFDGIANKIQLEENEKAKQRLSVETPEPNSAWQVSISQSRIDDSTTVVLSSGALETVHGRFNRVARPTLVLRCLENTTAAYIGFDGLHMTDHRGYENVTFRVDKNKAFTRAMRASTDKRALGLWSGGSAIPFIRNLFGGSVLLIHATPFNEAPVTFQVNIAGLEKAIAPLRKACNW
jgi:type VI secretion system protein VasI